MLFVHLFGHLRLFDSRQTFRFSALPKTLPLLSYLLLHVDAGPLSREKVAFTFWPDEPEENAKANLRRHLYDLQQALSEETSGKSWILRSRTKVAWNPASEYWLDVDEFKKLSASGDHLAKAVSLYSGDLLPDEYEDWLDPVREKYRQWYLENLNRLMLASKARKNYRQALAYAKQMLRYDPLQEEVMRQFMFLGYEQGDRAVAIQSYLDFVDLLEQELDVAPLKETVEVYKAVRDDTVDSLPGYGALEGESGRVPSGRTANNLPAQLISFIGRTLDLMSLHDVLVDPEQSTRLLTLTGPGGCGKTRLALDAARNAEGLTLKLNENGGSDDSRLELVTAVRTWPGRRIRKPGRYGRCLACVG